MAKFKHYILGEAAYQGNIGFMEMAQFYQTASKSDIKKMEQIVKKED
jgi:hypothetical protein